MRASCQTITILATAAAMALSAQISYAQLACRRAEPTLGPIPKYATPAAHMEQIRVVTQRQDEAICKLKPPLMSCRHVADGVIKIDGRPDEPAWRRADVATNFRDTRNLKPCQSKTVCRLLWDSKYLYVAFDCSDSDIIATIRQPDGDYWREDTAEVFIDPNADGMDYLEFEVSPLLHLYDGAIADYRPEVDWLQDLTHLDINKSRDIYRIASSKIGVHVEGSLNDSSDQDRGWTGEMAISWTDIARGTPMTSPVPQAGDLWRIGLYHIDHKAHGDPNFAENGAWSPTTTWFHAPRMFGRVVFTDAEK